VSGWAVRRYRRQFRRSLEGRRREPLSFFLSIGEMRLIEAFERAMLELGH